MIINSILDTDLYKLTMQQFVFYNYDWTTVEYKFVCRNKDIDLSFLKDKIEEEIKNLDRLRLTYDELYYLRSLNIFKTGYLQYLYDIFLFNFKKCIDIKIIRNKLEISIHGTWLETILYEVPILSIVNELYFKSFKKIQKETITQEKLKNKLSLLKNVGNLKFSDFGTRRRYSHKWHEKVINKCKKNKHFIGTSNVYFAMKYNLNPIGTMAHEFLQAYQGIIPRKCLRVFQKVALQEWNNFYPNSIALSDTISIEQFVKDFYPNLAFLYSGVRIDSGDPIYAGDLIVNAYKENGIDPKTKKLIFSDSLTFEKMIELYNYFKDKIQVSFGIGTNLTNDVGFNPLNIVIKMVKYNNNSVAKLSNEPSKCICLDKDFLKYLKEVFEC